MNTESGEIKDYDKIPDEEIPPVRNDIWSEPFKVGDEVVVLGVKMKIVKIKKQKKEIHLAHWSRK